MSECLLLDENLSDRLLPSLEEWFPSSRHIRLLGLSGAMLVTKDEDFLQLSIRRDFPPKVICLAIGNAGNAATAALLLDQAAVIEAFGSHPDAGFLVLRFPQSPP